jgi:hypothetical protein
VIPTNLSTQVQSNPDQLGPQPSPAQAGAITNLSTQVQSNPDQLGPQPSPQPGPISDSPGPLLGPAH